MESLLVPFLRLDRQQLEMAGRNSKPRSFKKLTKQQQRALVPSDGMSLADAGRRPALEDLQVIYMTPPSRHSESRRMADVDSITRAPPEQGRRPSSSSPPLPRARSHVDSDDFGSRSRRNQKDEEVQDNRHRDFNTRWSNEVDRSLEGNRQTIATIHCPHPAESESDRQSQRQRRGSGSSTMSYLSMPSAMPDLELQDAVVQESERSARSDLSSLRAIPPRKPDGMATYAPYYRGEGGPLMPGPTIPIYNVPAPISGWDNLPDPRGCVEADEVNEVIDNQPPPKSNPLTRHLWGKWGYDGDGNPDVNEQLSLDYLCNHLDFELARDVALVNQAVGWIPFDESQPNLWDEVTEALYHLVWPLMEAKKTHIWNDDVTRLTSERSLFLQRSHIFERPSDVEAHGVESDDEEILAAYWPRPEKVRKAAKLPRRARLYRPHRVLHRRQGQRALNNRKDMGVTRLSSPVCALTWKDAADILFYGATFIQLLWIIGTVVGVLMNFGSGN